MPRRNAARAAVGTFAFCAVLLLAAVAFAQGAPSPHVPVFADVLAWAEQPQVKATLIAFALWLAANVLNGLLAHYPTLDKGLPGIVLHTLLDRISVTVRADSPGSLKLPGVASQPPGSDVIGSAVAK